MEGKAALGALGLMQMHFVVLVQKVSVKREGSIVRSLWTVVGVRNSVLEKPNLVLEAFLLLNGQHVTAF